MGAQVHTYGPGAAPAVMAGVRRPGARYAPGLKSLVLVLWALCLFCLSAPGRSSPLDFGTLDTIALTKVTTRIAALVLLSNIILRTHATERCHWLLSRLIPLGIFAVWTMVSVVWSPIKAVSLGHGGETLMLVMLAIVTGIVCSEQDQLRTVLCHFVIITGLVILMLFVLNGTIWTRQPEWEYMQVNEVGMTAAAGLITLLASRFLWNWRWSRVLLLPGLLVFGTAVVTTQSRSCLIAIAPALVILCLLAPSRWFAVAGGIVGVVAAAWPYVGAVSRLPETVSEYVMRGQTEQDAITISGRTELWETAVNSFLDSPIFGYGYYSINSTGTVRVWGKEGWQTAHNAYLHVLTGTGSLGFCLLAWGLYWVLRPLPRYLRRGQPQRRAALLVLILVSFYVLLGLFELSFAGAVGPGTALFYVVLGIAAGQLRSHSLPRWGTAAPR